MTDIDPCYRAGSVLFEGEKCGALDGVIEFVVVGVTGKFDRANELNPHLETIVSSHRCNDGIRQARHIRRRSSPVVRLSMKVHNPGSRLRQRSAASGLCTSLPGTQPGRRGIRHRRLEPRIAMTMRNFKFALPRSPDRRICISGNSLSVSRMASVQPRSEVRNDFALISRPSTILGRPIPSSNTQLI